VRTCFRLSKLRIELGKIGEVEADFENWLEENADCFGWRCYDLNGSSMIGWGTGNVHPQHPPIPTSTDPTEQLLYRIGKLTDAVDQMIGKLKDQKDT
jgi:hypothetical protein